MQTALQSYEDYALITDAAERARVASLAARMVEIEGASSKMQMMAHVARQEGYPLKTLERMFYAWRKDGVLALADKRKIKVGETVSEILPIFKTYAENDKNTSRGGWRAMLRDFRAGQVFDFGTWRDVWAKEHPYEPLPDACPAAWIPCGWGYANLMRLMQRDPDRLMKLAWNRQGQFAAAKYKLPVIRSREGLKVGAVYQADDVWHNINVFAKGINGTFQPLEFAFYDVASAYKCGSFMKARTLSLDEKTGKEKRDNLNEFQFRTAFAYVCTCVGFCRTGVRFILERGTTAIRPNVQARIRQIPVFGQLITIQTSGVMNSPAHKGLFMGNAGGNPRFKSLTEGAHNVLHNASASLLGNRGRDAAHLHESHGALIRASEKAIAKANALDENLLDLLQLGVMSMEKFTAAFYQVEAEVMNRTDHALEGWTEHETVEYRDLTSSTGWRDLVYLKGLDEVSRNAIAAQIRQDPATNLRKRKLSRAEVWRKGQENLVKVPLFEVPQFLDPRDAKEGKVGADGVISFRDQVYYPGKEMRYAATYKDRGGIPHRLAPGTKVRFYWNPWGDLSKMIWLADEDDNILGICRELQAATWSDPHSIKVAAGQQLKQIAEATRDMAGRHHHEAARKMAEEIWNEAVFKTAGTAVPTFGKSPRHGEPRPSLRGEAEAIHSDDPIGFLEKMNNLQTTTN